MDDKKIATCKCLREFLGAGRCVRIVHAVYDDEHALPTRSDPLGTFKNGILRYSDNLYVCLHATVCEN